MSELIDELRKIDEITLLELLNVTSDDLIDAFLDLIKDNEDKLKSYIHE
jgi:tRNA A37 methylthiotransferase MiaB